MEAEAQAIKCWNAYIESHDGKEPPSVTDFQGWLKLGTNTHFSHNVSYSKSYDIYDDYVGKGKIDDSISDQSHQTIPSLSTIPPQIQILQAPNRRNARYYEKLKEKKKQQSNAQPSQPDVSDTSTAMTPPSPASFQWNLTIERFHQPSTQPISQTPPGTSLTRLTRRFPYHNRKPKVPPNDTQMVNKLESDQKHSCESSDSGTSPSTDHDLPTINRVQSSPGGILTASLIKVVTPRK
eukprot:236342_1